MYIDYAHTPEALEVVLNSLRNICSRRLWIVFGCGGDRDRAKRKEMGAVAERLADVSVLTSDNPRSEEPLRIVEDIAEGFADKTLFQVKLDRAEAISWSLRQLQAGDILLIAGKGHEDYQVQGLKTFTLMIKNMCWLFWMNSKQMKR